MTYAVGVLARYVSNPGAIHYRAIQRLLVYLASTVDKGLLLAPSMMPLEAYSDANWASKFSTSGGLILVYGCAVMWYSRLQRSVSHSTAEAEYVAASMGCREEIFVSELMEDLGHKVNKPMPIYLDSKSAIDMAFDPVSFKKTKHILRDAYYLRDLVARRKVKPSHVASLNQRADMYTKAIPRALFRIERDRLLVDVDAPS